MPTVSYRYLEELADEWEPRLRTAFLAAIQEIRGRISIAALAAQLERGDIEGALRLVGLDPGDFSLLALESARAFHEGGMATANAMPALRSPEGFKVQARFDVRNPAAEEWVRERSSTLVREIVDDQRVTIRQHLTGGLEAGQNPRRVALDLVGRVSRTSNERTGGVVGLHSTQERWLASYSRDLASADPADLQRLLTRGLRDKRFDRSVAKAIREGTALPAELQAKMRLAYSNRALRWRAENIARTETLAALNTAQHQAYRQAVDKGQVRESDIRRYWHTAGDERVRHTHRMIPGMNKEGVGLDEPFLTPNGPVMNPPAGPMCRCHVRVKIDFLARVAERVRRAA